MKGSREDDISVQSKASGRLSIINAAVRVLDDAGTVASSITIEDGRIVAVGGETAEHTIDVGGAMVVPGFVDAHHHVSIAALYGGQIDLSTARDIDDVQARLRDAAAALPAAGWLVATNWDEARLRERRPPTRAELDEAVGDRPLFALHYTCHRAVANSAALRLAEVDEGTADPAGGLIERGVGRRPTGLLVERGMSRVEALARTSLVERDREPFLERMAAHYRDVVAAGITLLADTTVPLDLLGLYDEAARRDLVMVPTIICPVSVGGWLEAPHDVLDAALEFDDAGPLSLGPIKLVFDGAPQCSMCMSWFSAIGAAARTGLATLRRASLDPLRATMSVKPRLGAQVRSGLAIYDSEEAAATVRLVAAHGFAVATHAIGNEAVRIALDAYAAAGDDLHSAAQARLEHASFLDRGLVARLAAMDVAVAVQPDFIRLLAHSNAASIPGLPFQPLRQLLDAGVRVAGSSDYPVAGFAPLDGIRSAVRRTSVFGEIREPHERISFDEALRMYTQGAALTCDRSDRGTLEVGKRADFVVLDGSVADLDGLRVRQTWIAGVRVWPHH